MTNVYSKCGMNCSRCPWSKTVRAPMTDEEFEEFGQGAKKVLGYRPTDFFSNCVGCQTPDDEIPKGDRIPLRNCLTRLCVTRNEIVNCAYCSRFPCAYIEVAGTEWTREKMEAKRGKPMSEEEYRTYFECFEGLKYMKALRTSINEEELVDPVKMAPLKLKIVDFPTDLSFSNKEIKLYKALHQLFRKIKTSSLDMKDIDTYAQQQRLKRRIPYFLRFLWIFGRFGVFKKENGGFLEVDPETYVSNRGSEKHLMTLSFLEPVVLKKFPDFGVQGELIPLDKKWKTRLGGLKKKGWIIRMHFDDSLGGKEGLKTLQDYAMKLEKKYGKRAFRYFKDADMRVLGEN